MSVSPALETALPTTHRGKVSPIRPELARGRKLTDVGAGERFALQFGDRFRYAHATGQWFHYDGRRWVEDTNGETMRAAKAIARSLYEEAARETDADQRARVAQFAVTTERANRLEAVLICARSEPEFPIAVEQFDADPMRLNVANGTIDLRTGQLVSHSSADLVTRLAPCTYEPTARCDRWERFLLEIMGGDPSLVAFLQRAIGYAATGLTTEQCLFMLYGIGRNGKTTFLEVIRRVLGDYALAIDASTLMARRSDGAREDVARLRGARFVSAVEANDGARFDEGLLKGLTGGDPITARHLYAGSFTFTPALKLFFASNHKPTIRGTDLGIWRRVRLVPFTVTIPENRVDLHLLETLISGESDGILAWIVSGALLWQRDGLRAPDVVRAATDAYRVESDTLGRFIDERCELASEAEEKAGVLYLAYRRWCEQSGERHVMTSTAFGRALEERGHSTRRANGIRRQGIRLRILDGLE